MITKKTKKILWLTAIAMITIFIAFACSEKPTESANLSSSSGAGTTITPPTGGGTSSQPALKITDWGAIQFDGLTFKNENHTVNIVVKKLGGNNSQARFELNGKTYGFGSRIYNSQYNPNTFIFGNINNDISDKGYAEFRESGDLLIWFNNNQSDLIRLKLVNNTDGEKPEMENYLIPQEYWGTYNKVISSYDSGYTPRAIVYSNRVQYYNTYHISNYIGQNTWYCGSGYDMYLEFMLNEKGQRVLNEIIFNKKYTNVYIMNDTNK